MQILLSTESHSQRLNRKKDKKTTRAKLRDLNTSGANLPSSFQEIMDGVLPVEDKSNLDLHHLWQELPQWERTFLSEPSTANLQGYRAVVIQIAKQTLKKNVSLKKIKKLNSHKEKVELTLLQVLDERLQKMATLMLSPQNSAFSMLKLLDEIRGILLDVRQ